MVSWILSHSISVFTQMFPQNTAKSKSLSKHLVSNYYGPNIIYRDRHEWYLVPAWDNEVMVLHTYFGRCWEWSVLPGVWRSSMKKWMDWGEKQCTGYPGVNICCPKDVLFCFVFSGSVSLDRISRVASNLQWCSCIRLPSSTTITGMRHPVQRIFQRTTNELSQTMPPKHWKQIKNKMAFLQFQGLLPKLENCPF